MSFTSKFVFTQQQQVNRALTPSSSYSNNIRFYSCKALSTISSLRLLGNSARGLLPHLKRTLFHACVLPIATYGYRLWYHQKACVAGLLKSLDCMQYRTALWITGCFKTTPIGAACALARIMPIHLLLDKFSSCSSHHFATLHHTHGLHSLSDSPYTTVQHPTSVEYQTPRQQRLVHNALHEACKVFPFVEPLILLHPLSCPGSHLVNTHSHQFSFHPVPKGDDETKIKDSVH